MDVTYDKDGKAQYFFTEDTWSMVMSFFPVVPQWERLDMLLLAPHHHPCLTPEVRESLAGRYVSPVFTGDGTGPTSPTVRDLVRPRGWGVQMLLLCETKTGRKQAEESGYFENQRNQFDGIGDWTDGF